MSSHKHSESGTFLRRGEEEENSKKQFSKDIITRRKFI